MSRAPPGLPVAYLLAGRRFSHAEWEALCTGCGLCCYEKVQVGRRLFASSTPCRFLDADHRCRVYEQRLDACPECVKVTPEVVRQGGALPDDCPYVVLWRELEEPWERHVPARAGRRRGRD